MRHPELSQEEFHLSFRRQTDEPPETVYGKPVVVQRGPLNLSGLTATRTRLRVVHRGFPQSSPKRQREGIILDCVRRTPRSANQPEVKAALMASAMPGGC